MSSGLSHVEFERDYYDSLLRSRSSMMRPWMLSCCSMPGDPSVPRRGPGHRAAERTQNLDSKVLFVLSSPQVTNKEKTEASRRKHGTWSCLIISNQISVSTNENSFWFFCYFHCRWPGDHILGAERWADLYGESVIYFYMLDDNLETNVASLNSISSWQCLFYIILKTRHIDL